MALKLVFCGTPEFAVPTLEAVLAAGHEVPLVVTQPDKAVGRKAEMQAPPVKRIAAAHGIRVVQPEKIKQNGEFRAQNERGEWFEAEGTELLSRAFQHEIDHLNGILFIDRISRLKRELALRKIRKMQKAGEW